jgi:hypothetical protein
MAGVDEPAPSSGDALGAAPEDGLDEPPGRRGLDDNEVSLAFYGAIVYLAIVAALGSEDHPPPPTEAIAAVVLSGSVLYVAHVFAALVPRAARAGRLHLPHLLHALRHDLPLLATVLVPIVPLILGTSGALADATAYRLSIRLTIALLFVLAVLLSRLDGLSWRRALVAGATIIAVAVVVIWLEAKVH